MNQYPGLPFHENCPCCLYTEESYQPWQICNVLSQAPTYWRPFNYLGDLCQGNGLPFTWVLKLYHLKGGHGDWIKEILKVLLPLPDNIPGSGQQFPIQTKHSPEQEPAFYSLSCWMVCQNVLLGLSDFLHLSFCFLYGSCSPSGHFFYLSSEL